MQNFFAANLIFLRENKGLNQAEAALALDLSRSTYANYEAGINEPKLDVLMKIIGLYGVAFEDLVYKDLKKGKVITAGESEKIGQKSKVISKEIGKLTTEKVAVYSENEIKLTVAYDPESPYNSHNTMVPFADISAAAGGGTFNTEYQENVDYMSLPTRFLKRGAIYAGVRVKGPSMAPGMQDGGYAAVRFIPRESWLQMPDKEVYVVVTKDGATYIKRVKNRFKKGFIVLVSDNPDKATHGNFNLEIDEIHTIWHVDLYMTHRLPDIHGTYYNKMQELEERLEVLERGILPFNREVN